MPEMITDTSVEAAAENIKAVVFPGKDKREGAAKAAAAFHASTSAQQADAKPAPAEATTQAQADARDPEPGEGDAKPVSRETDSAATPEKATDGGDKTPTPADAGPSTSSGQDPSVEPPAGWTDEDRAWFQSLPPEKQAVVAKREREYRANESRRHNEHTEALRTAQAARDAAAQDRQHLAQAIAAFQHPLITEFRQKFADVAEGKLTPVQLANTDPLRFQEFQAYQTQFAQIGQAQRALAMKAEEDAQANFVQFRAAENAKLVETIPELQDEGKRKAFDAEISGFLTGLGYSREEIVRASARDISIARKAMLYDRAQAARDKAEKAPGQPPKVERPGTAERRDGKGERKAADLNRLAKSGRVEDAASFMRHLIQ